MKDLKFKACFKSIRNSGRIWLQTTVNKTINTKGIIQVTDWLQFIGMKDKNNEEIFEDDIVKFKLDIGNNTMIDLIGSFTFGEDLSFEIDIYNNPEYITLHYINNGRFHDFEIIGNKKENPELWSK